MLTKEDVTWLYRCILGREPENDAAIAGHIFTHASLETARPAFLRSVEFGDLYRDLCGDNVFFRPQAPTPWARGSATLALTAIVKNERENIEGMIRSCSGIVDFVAIVDAYSSDGTAEFADHILREINIPYHVAQIEFVNFSQARNAALALVPSNIQWTLMLDGDERMEAEDFPLLLSMLQSETVDVWTLPRFNFIDKAKAAAAYNYPDRQARLIRNRPGNPFQFTGAVHESLQNVERWGHAPVSGPGPNGIVGGPHIHHMSLAYQSPERAGEKSQFYYNLMQNDIYSDSVTPNSAIK